MKHYFTTAAVALVLGAGVLLASGTLRANDTESVTVAATVIEPVVITVNTNLQFGNVGGLVGDTIILTTTGSRTPSTTAFAAPGITATAGDFSITCADGVNVQATTANPTMSNGYTIGTFVFSPNLATSTACADQSNVKIGATLTFPASPPTGAQTGSFDLTVAYQ